MTVSLADHLKKRPEFRDASRRARLTYLYSDLSQARVNNPTGYTSAASWWSNLIEEVVSKGLQDGGSDTAETADKLVWHLDQNFCDRLRWEGAGRPTGLGTVAMQMSQAKPPMIVPMKVFQTSTQPIDSFSWPRWLVLNLVGAPLWWSMSKLGIVDNGNAMNEAKAWKLAAGDWVMMGSLKTAAENVIKRLAKDSSIVERMFSLASFTETFASTALAGVKLTTVDIDILLRYLARDKRVLVRDGGVIKVLTLQDEATVVITEAERGILEVKDTSAALERQINDLEKRISERQERIAKYLRSNQKDLALSHLRSKKALQEVLSKRTLAYENLHAVLLKIEAAESDMAILGAYSSATASLKALLNHPTLQRDNVENTMEDLKEALADQKEIEDIVTAAGSKATGLDVAEDDIQAELQEMEEEAKREKQKAEEAQELREKHKAASSAEQRAPGTEAESLPAAPFHEPRKDDNQAERQRDRAAPMAA